MSLAITRSAIAAALSTLTGVTGTEYRPNLIGEGAAWPQVARFDRADGGAYQITWSVFIALGADERSASAFMDTLVPGLIDALDDEMFIDSMEPVTIQVSGGELFALQIAGRSE